MKCIFSVKVNGDDECGAFGTGNEFTHALCDGVTDKDYCPWWNMAN